MTIITTSTNFVAGVLFSLSVCLSVCVSVSRITQNVRVDFHEIWGTDRLTEHRRVDLIFVYILWIFYHIYRSALDD